MGIELHKKGQGTLSRSTAYTIGAALIVFGALRLFATINRPGQNVLVDALPVVGAVTVYKVIALVVGAAGLLGLHWILNKPRTVDLLIETETEMRKVSWPTLPEVWNATLVVCLVTVVLAITMSVFDLGLRKLFQLVF